MAQILCNATVYGKTSAEESFAVIHSNANVFLPIMALSISNISLYRSAKAKGLLRITIFSTQNAKVFPRGCFPVYVRYNALYGIAKLKNEVNP